MYSEGVDMGVLQMYNKGTACNATQRTCIKARCTLLSRRKDPLVRNATRIHTSNVLELSDCTTRERYCAMRRHRRMARYVHPYKGEAPSSTVRARSRFTMRTHMNKGALSQVYEVGAPAYHTVVCTNAAHPNQSYQHATRTLYARTCHNRNVRPKGRNARVRTRRTIIRPYKRRTRHRHVHTSHEQDVRPGGRHARVHTRRTIARPYKRATRHAHV